MKEFVSCSVRVAMDHVVTGPCRGGEENYDNKVQLGQSLING